MTLTQKLELNEKTVKLLSSITQNKALTKNTNNNFYFFNLGFPPVPLQLNKPCIYLFPRVMSSKSETLDMKKNVQKYWDLKPL